MNKNFTGKWWISQNEEWFSTGPFDSKKDAISEGRAIYGDEGFWVAESVNFLDLVSPDIDLMLEKLEERIWEISNVEDGPQIELSKDDHNELQDIVKKFLISRATINNFAISHTQWIDGQDKESL